MTNFTWLTTMTFSGRPMTALRFSWTLTCTMFHHLCHYRQPPLKCTGRLCWNQWAPPAESQRHLALRLNGTQFRSSSIIGQARFCDHFKTKTLGKRKLYFKTIWASCHFSMFQLECFGNHKFYGLFLVLIKAWEQLAHT